MSMDIDKKMCHKPPAIGISRKELESRLPKGANHKVTDAILGMIANLESDTDLDQGMMEEQVLQSLHILDGKNRGKLESYVNAVKFVNLKQFMSNREAYSIVFREKFNQLEEDGKQVDNFVSMYNSSFMVTELDKKIIIPPSLQYNHIFHEMIANLANVARGVSASGRDVTPLVQVSAASKLVDVLAPSESSQVDVVVGMDDATKSVQQNLADQLKRSTDFKMKQIEAGVDIREVQKLHINAEAIDVEVDDE